MARRKMDREERMEYRGGKYMGGPAEEKAEKMKKKTKRMADGGSAGPSRRPLERPGMKGLPSAPARRPLERPGMKGEAPVGGGRNEDVPRGMLRRYENMKERFPGYDWGKEAPDTREEMRDQFKEFRDWRKDQRDEDKESNKAPKSGGGVGSRVGSPPASGAAPIPAPNAGRPVDNSSGGGPAIPQRGSSPVPQSPASAGGGIGGAAPIPMPTPQRPLGAGAPPPVAAPVPRPGAVPRPMVVRPVAMKKGGVVRGNGCAQRGHTRGRIM